MNKSELVRKVATETGISLRETEVVLDGVLGTIENQLAKGTKVTISGFGTFDIGKRQDRKGVNPRTGEEISIAATTMPRFKSSRSLRNATK